MDRGVFYPKTGPGVVWNGLTSIKETLSDSEQRVRYIDGVKTGDRLSKGQFSGVIEAFTYPDSFYENVLVQRRSTSFGLSYRSGSEIHIVYNVLLSPTSYSYTPSNAEPFKWNFTTLPISIPEAKRSSHLVVDTRVAYSWTVESLEAVLYGSGDISARLPSPQEVFQIFEDNSILQIVDNGDGTWTATGPDEVIQMLDPTTFQINWPSAVYVDENTYTIHSL